jgi:hypothetical protein
MDARAYFELSDGIAAAATPEQLHRLEARIAATEMHPVERRALERVVQVRRELIAGAAPKNDRSRARPSTCIS